LKFYSKSKKINELDLIQKNKGKQAKLKTWFSIVWLVALYLTGIYLWGKFLNWGDIPFDFQDWAEVNAARLAYMRDAVIRGIFPLHASEIGHLRNLTDRILSIPDVIITPQMILMRWMDVGTFILINTFFLYTLGFLGLLWFRREYKLSPIIFSSLVLLFNFNGHLVSHFSIGHVTWWSNLILPLFFVQVFRFLKGEDNWAWVAETSFFLFFLFLQGGYHQYTWCLIFLGFLMFTTWKRFLPILKVLIFSNLLTMVRLLPPALLLDNFDTDFLGGYPHPWQILQAMLVARSPEQSLPFQIFNSGLGYWEFDLYIGFIGFAFISLGMAIWLIFNYRQKTFPVLLVPMAIMVIFSISNFYRLFSWLPIPLLAAERVPSRMLFIPFTLAMILSTLSIEHWRREQKQQLFWNLLLFVGFVYLVYDLVRNLLQWQVIEAVRYYPVTPVNLLIKVIANHSDTIYVNSLIIGGIVSIITLIFLVGMVLIEKNKKKFRPFA
jgi:hypothetical protein